MTAAPNRLEFPRDKLGLCMIVKNEERALARCLESVRDWVGEMVVVDTGSTDDTVHIAARFGARISHFVWCDDFSAARNAALDQCTCEWVLVLDGDETLVVDDPSEFAATLRQNQWDGFSLPIRSLNDDGTHSKAMVFRLFRRNRTGMRYRGEIHEQLEAVASGNARTSALSCVHLDHDGYTEAVVASANKAQRNIRLSRKLTESRPNDPFSWFVFAMALGQSDRDAMLDATRRAIALIDMDPARVRGEHYVVNLYLLAINDQRSRGDVEQTLALAQRALSLFPQSPDLLYQRGVARVAAGDFAGAAIDFQTALGDAAKSFGLVVDPASTGHGARTGLAHALRHLGRPAEATAQLDTAIADAPADYASAHAEMGTWLLDSGQVERAAPFFEEAHRRNPKDSAVAFKLAWCLYKMAQMDSAERILQAQGGDQQTELLLARIWLETGRADQVLVLLTANTLPVAGLLGGWAHFVLGHGDDAAKAWDRWLANTPDEDPTKKALVLWRLLMGEGAGDPAPRTVGESLRDMDAWLVLLLRYQKTEVIDQILCRSAALLGVRWPEVRLRWAQTMVMGGFVDAGMPLLFEAAEESPQNGAIYYWLGYCAVLRQQPDDARVLFEECLRHDPQHPQARLALGLL